MVATVLNTYTKAVIERVLMANSGPRDYNYSGTYYRDVITRNYEFLALRPLNDEWHDSAGSEGKKSPSCWTILHVATFFVFRQRITITEFIYT